MKRSWLVWIGFALCVAVTAAAMTWVTCAVVRLDRAEAESRRQAALEESVRLALWRADATLAPLVTQESLAPWLAYRPFLPNRQPSPFLAAATPHVLVHFQFEPDGRMTSPEVPPPGGARYPGSRARCRRLDFRRLEFRQPEGRPVPRVGGRTAVRPPGGPDDAPATRRNPSSASGRNGASGTSGGRDTRTGQPIRPAARGRSQPSRGNASELRAAGPSRV